MDARTLGKILADAARAARTYPLFEDTFRRVEGAGLDYLRVHSRAYKTALASLQELVFPAVQRICPDCRELCCQLLSPDRQIYIAPTVGGFVIADYLLVRCDTELPSPDFGQARSNLCPFLGDGCRLPTSCRSICCSQWFCTELEAALDMQQVRPLVASMHRVLREFSVGRCLALSAGAHAAR